MKAKRIKITLICAAFLLVFALGFCIVGILTPSEQFDEVEGFSKVFAASPELGFESGSFVTTFGDYSLSINFSFDKPLLSLLGDGPVIHINFIVLLVIIGGMLISCMIPEVSIVTSAIVGALVAVCIARIAPFLRATLAEGATSWEAAASCFWFVAFLFGALIANGLVGVGGKVVGTIFVSEKVKIFVTFFFAAILANAVSLFLCLFVYLTVGIGWCGGVMLWFVVTVLLVAFCEVLDIISF